MARARRAPFFQANLGVCYFLSGKTTVFDEPSGAACMPGAVSPCGLEAGAPPLVVLIGPVQPCGGNCPLASGVTVRPVVDINTTCTTKPMSTTATSCWKACLLYT